MAKQATVPERELEAMKALVMTVRGTLNLPEPLKQALKHLDDTKDPYSEVKAGLCTLLEEGIEDAGHSITDDDRWVIRKVIDEIFSGSDWPAELAFVTYNEIIDTIEPVPIFGLISPRDLRTQLAERLGLERTPEGEWRTAEQVRAETPPAPSTRGTVSGTELDPNNPMSKGL